MPIRAKTGLPCTRRKSRSHPPDRRSAPSSVGPRRPALSDRRAGRRHRIRPQRRRHRLCRVPLDVSRRRAGSVAPGRRGRVRQWRRGDERERRLRPGGDLRRHRRPRQPAARRGRAAVLEAEIAAGDGRFRGIRHSSAWDADPDVAGMYALRPKGLLLDAGFRKGFACLAPLGLSFDAWLFHPQIGELTDLARAFPDTQIVLDHCGGPIGVGGYADRREEIFPAGTPRSWTSPNVRTLWSSSADWRCVCSATISQASEAAVFGRRGCRLAAIHRNLHRGVRSAPLHVREQFSAGQRPVQLPGDLQRRQAHCGRLQ